ncbi:MAG: transcriptional regulator [Candidatus Omnitrophica bacterium]|nr:transcriptional regulator [Candidatus Omnitrophota bacterium]
MVKMLPKDRGYDKKVFRLISVLNKLDREGKVYSRILAEEFNVSMRTIQRDLELLNMTGFLLDSPEKGLYKFSEGFSLKKMKLTNEEASLLTVLFEITKSLGGNFEKSFRGIMAKVLSEEYDSPFYIKMPQGMKISKDHPFIKEIEEAIDECEKIAIHYKSHEKEGDYRLCPLKIMFFDGFWYLLAHPEGKKWLTKFRIENITKVETVGGHFTSPKNLKAILDESINILFPDTRDKVVTLRLDKEIARYFKKRRYFPLQKIKKTNKDGALIVETKVGNFAEILPVIFRWIPHISVTSPVALRDEVKKRVEEFIKKL